MIDRLTCLLCPLGCELEADIEAPGPDARMPAGEHPAEDGVDGGGETLIVDGRRLWIKGHRCPEGIDFAVEEILRPKRNLAASVPLAGTADRMVSVRLSDRVPREMMFPILAEIASLRPVPPVRRGEVLIRNVCGAGVDVIATRTMGDERPA